MKIYSLIVLMIVMGAVSAQGSYDASAAETAKEKAADSWFGWWIALFSLEAFTTLFLLGWQFIFLGGLAAFAILALLQYLGFDIIGWTFDIIKFVFDNVFLLLRWTLSSEANLISMVILFLLLWIILLGMVPGVSLSPTADYSSATTTTIKTCEDGIPCGSVCCALNQQCVNGNCQSGLPFP